MSIDTSNQIFESINLNEYVQINEDTEISVSLYGELFPLEGPDLSYVRETLNALEYKMATITEIKSYDDIAPGYLFALVMRNNEEVINVVFISDVKINVHFSDSIIGSIDILGAPSEQFQILLEFVEKLSP